jgi:hypothetical protein
MFKAMQIARIFRPGHGDILARLALKLELLIRSFTTFPCADVLPGNQGI